MIKKTIIRSGRHRLKLFPQKKKKKKKFIQLSEILLVELIGIILTLLLHNVNKEEISDAGCGSVKKQNMSVFRK